MPLSNTPAYKAGLDIDDEIRTIDGARISSDGDLTEHIQRRKPGDSIKVEYVDRAGTAKTARVVLEEDPRQEIVTIERSGGSLTPDQRAFRKAWLGTN